MNHLKVGKHAFWGGSKWEEEGEKELDFVSPLYHCCLCSVLVFILCCFIS